MSESVRDVNQICKKIKCCEAEIKILTETETETERKEILIRKIKYHNAKIKILTSNQNKGEKAEVLLLIKLYHLNELERFDKLIEIFGEEASEGISILNLATDEEILDINKFSKAPSGYKADCKIIMKKTKNVYSISIKSKHGGNPAILNHTHRKAKIFQEGGILYDYLPCLDTILQEYISKRVNKTICEDTPITNLTCLKDDHSLKEKFIEVLTYFVFDGSGKGYSKCSANAIMTYSDKITFMKCDSIQDKKTYVESIYDKIVISLRNKGMPELIPEYCKPWIFDDIQLDNSIKHKGGLHIRIK
jgi:hypothetical protein